MERLLQHKVYTLELMVRVLLDELVDTEVVDFESIMERVDEIEKETEEKVKEAEDRMKKADEDIIRGMYYGPKGEA